VLALAHCCAGDEGRVRRAAFALLLGVFGASLYATADHAAISVLSAVEGLKVAAPSVKDWCCRSRRAILVLLFAVQRWAPIRSAGYSDPSWSSGS